MDLECVTSRSSLEAVVGTQPLGSMLKSIAAFDQHCADLLALSPLAIIGTTDVGGDRRSVVIGGAPGFASVPEPTRLALDLPVDLQAAPEAGAGLLFLIPGLGETLRVNGRISAAGDGIDAEEIYVHCAKAILRSELWTSTDHGEREPSGGDDGGDPLDAPGVRDFLARSPFAVVTSSDALGAADASPKGDPAGFVQVLDGRTLAFPDRPGNRRTDSFHNLVDDPAVGLVALVPGDDRVLELQGTARLTTDGALRATMAVHERTPKLAVLVDVERATLQHSHAVATSGVWDPSTHVDPATLPKMTQVWADHVKQNEQGGLAARAIRTAVTAKVLEKSIAIDYERNLY